LEILGIFHLRINMEAGNITVGSIQAGSFENGGSRGPSERKGSFPLTLVTMMPFISLSILFVYLKHILR
jgi:hypothetical protein